jgi:glycosyltransferase involved in cell wall biosynthesis
MSSEYKGWILDGIIKESAIACFVPLNLVFIPHGKKSYLKIRDVIKFYLNRKPQGNCLFAPQNTYFRVVKDQIFTIDPARVNVLYTHFSELQFPKSEQLNILSQCSKIFVGSTYEKNQLINLGVNAEKTDVVYGGVNRKNYFPQIIKKTNDYVLISSQCHIRKRPNLVIEIIRRMQEVDFIIIGRGWREYYSKCNIPKPTNLTIVDFNLEKNSELMRNASVFLSLSVLEGGPYGTIEALASGTPVVVTNTGWNPEVVNDSNGVLLDIDASIDCIITAIQATIQMKEKVRHLDLIKGKFKFENFGRAIFL